jgi:hypothetical protein
LTLVGVFGAFAWRRLADPGETTALPSADLPGMKAPDP